MLVIHFARLKIFVFFAFIFEQLTSCGRVRQGQIVTAAECLENSSLQIGIALQFCQLNEGTSGELKLKLRNT